MQCPECPEQTRVIDSRASEDAIRRRRVCLGCGRRFTTYERIAEMEPAVVKRDGRREPFRREKILASVRLACVKRPIAYTEIDTLVESVRTRVMQSAKTEISSDDLGVWVMERLQAIDNVAAFRFASVFRRPDDIAALHQELTTLNTKTTKTALNFPETKQPSLPGILSTESPLKVSPENSESARKTSNFARLDQKIDE